jgi:hypothetical protein
MAAVDQRDEDRRMRTTDIDGHASELLEAAKRFQSAAEEPGCHVAAPEALVSLEETLQALSAAWYQLAADAATSDGLSREREVQLIGTLHDLAAGFARCARTCRTGRSAVTPILARSVDQRRVTEQVA